MLRNVANIDGITEVPTCRGGWENLKTKLPLSVSCLFGHYPSSQFLNKITTFQRLALSPSSGDKGKGKREVILAGGSLRQS
jgi:hypothetical protein